MSPPFRRRRYAPAWVLFAGRNSNFIMLQFYRTVRAIQDESVLNHPGVCQSPQTKNRSARSEARRAERFKQPACAVCDCWLPFHKGDKMETRWMTCCRPVKAWHGVRCAASGAINYRFGPCATTKTNTVGNGFPEGKRGLSKIVRRALQRMIAGSVPVRDSNMRACASSTSFAARVRSVER